MKLPLSTRLAACCSFVKPGARIADIGCDHGYLGIYLLKNGIANAVIAADIHQQPLNSAYHNAHKFGVADKIRFYLSDGAANIARDFDTMVCAGMGADTIISILSAAPWLKSDQYSLILQCQSKLPQLRRYLSQEGYCITEETVLRDGRFLYTVMKVIYRPGTPLTSGQCYFPPAMLRNCSPLTAQYYQRVLAKLTHIVTNRKQIDSAITDAYNEVKALAAQPAFAWLKEENHDDCK